MKNFKIVIELDAEQTVFETVNNEKKVDKIIDEYLPHLPQSVKVYKLDKETNAYNLTFSKTKRPEKEYRPIGFGRW